MERFLGRGASATVWEAVRSDNHQRVAVKAQLFQKGFETRPFRSSTRAKETRDKLIGRPRSAFLLKSSGR